MSASLLYIMLKISDTHTFLYFNVYEIFEKRDVM